MSTALTTALSSLPTPLRALVVGGTGGIGLAVAQHLSTLPSSRITISGRNAPSLSTPLPNNIAFKRLDASSLRNVKTFSSELITELKDDKLDILVMSQGLLTLQGRTETPEGLDIKMVLHYYSRMLLIRELLPSLSPSAIVISIYDGKGGDPSGKSLNWADMDLALPGSYSLAKVAAHCISYTDIMIQDLAASSSSSGRMFIHSRPGAVDTGIVRNSNMPWYLKSLAPVLSLFLVTPAYSAEKLLVGAVEAWKDGGNRWRNLDDQGKALVKVESEGEVRRKVREFTWRTVDEAAGRKDLGAQ